ncbi:MAG TPA: hypothetical protein VNZ52_16405 [Candidatus Thermoplasmatota archaeon]|nr:hypothetical protein [Candidatus Thermoplasmatota archaeon]
MRRPLASLLVPCVIVAQAVLLAGCLNLEEAPFRQLLDSSEPPVEARVIDPDLPPAAADQMGSNVEARTGARAPDGAGALERTFTWQEAGREFRLTAAIDPGRYEEARDRPRSYNVWGYAQYAADPSDDPLITALADGLRASAAEAGLGEQDLPQLALDFVQSISYILDRDSMGREDYPRYPVETLAEGRGDCEDLSFLYAALLRELGYGTVLLLYPGHLVAGVAMTEPRGFGVAHGGTWYAYAEPTAPGWRIGEAPEEYQQEEAVVLAIEHQAIPEFSWTIRHDAAKASYVLQLTFYNNGTAPAQGLRIWMGVEAQQGGVWSQRWFSVPTVAAHGVASKTFVLPEGAPDGAQVRLRAVIQADAVPYFEAVSPWWPAP